MLAKYVIATLIFLTFDLYCCVINPPYLTVATQLHDCEFISIFVLIGTHKNTYYMILHDTIEAFLNDVRNNYYRNYVIWQPEVE